MGDKFLIGQYSATKNSFKAVISPIFSPVFTFLGRIGSEGRIVGLLAVFDRLRSQY